MTTSCISRAFPFEPAENGAVCGVCVWCVWWGVGGTCVEQGQSERTLPSLAESGLGPAPGALAWT